MGKVYGRRVQEGVINIKENGSMTKSKVMEFSHGQTGVSTKEITKTILESVLEN